MQSRQRLTLEQGAVKQSRLGISCSPSLGILAHGMRSSHPTVKQKEWWAVGVWDSFLQTRFSIVKGSNEGSLGACWEAEKGEKDCNESCRVKSEKTNKQTNFQTKKKKKNRCPFQVRGKARRATRWEGQRAVQLWSEWVCKSL